MRSHCTRADCLCTVHCCSRTTRVQSAISREASMWCDDAEAANADFLSPRITAGDERTKSKITKDLGLQGKEAASKPTAATASRCSDAARERVVDVARWTALPLELGRAESRWRGEEGKVEEANNLLVRVGTVGFWLANRWAELERVGARLQASRAQLDRKTLRFSKLIRSMHAWQQERNADASGMPEPPTRAESNENDPTRPRLLAPTALASRMCSNFCREERAMRVAIGQLGLLLVLSRLSLLAHLAATWHASVASRSSSKERAGAWSWQRAEACRLDEARAEDCKLKLRVWLARLPKNHFPRTLPRLPHRQLCRGLSVRV